MIWGRARRKREKKISEALLQEKNKSQKAFLRKYIVLKGLGSLNKCFASTPPPPKKKMESIVG